MIKYGKRVRSCLLDGGNGIVHVKQKGYSWMMNIFKGRQHHTIASWPVEHDMEETNNPGSRNSQREAKNIQCDSGCVEKMMGRRER